MLRQLEPERLHNSRQGQDFYGLPVIFPPLQPDNTIGATLRIIRTLFYVDDGAHSQLAHVRAEVLVIAGLVESV